MQRIFQSTPILLRFPTLARERQSSYGLRGGLP